MLKFQVSSGAPMFDIHVPVPKLVKTGTFKLLLLRIKGKTTQRTVTVKTLKQIFSKWPPPHMQPLKTCHIHIFQSRNVI